MKNNLKNQYIMWKHINSFYNYNELIKLSDNNHISFIFKTNNNIVNEFIIVNFYYFFGHLHVKFYSFIHHLSCQRSEINVYNEKTNELISYLSKYNFNKNFKNILQDISKRHFNNLPFDNFCTISDILTRIKY